MAWKQGPLPPGTYNWGGVVLDTLNSGFYFADFRGDHVVVFPGAIRYEPDQIVLYDNSLELPTSHPKVKTRMHH